MTKPELMNHLTYAEILRNSNDIFREPNTPNNLGEHEIVIRTHGRFIDELETFDKQLSEFELASTLFTEDESVYEKLRSDHDTMRQETWEKPHRIGRAVLRAAGGHIGNLRRELYDSRNTWQAAGDELSRMLASYMHQYLPDQKSIQINGQTYYLDEGYLTKRVTKDGIPNNRWLYTIFGTPETTQEFNTKYFTPDKNRKIFAKIADTEDWHKLISNFRKSNLF